jgi:RNA polymerase sigma-70 factor (ECF subfamily)
MGWYEGTAALTPINKKVTTRCKATIRMADAFKTTRWSLIVAATSGNATANDALSELCQVYWRPVYAYIRRHGHDPDESADLTQAFFLYLLEHRAFERADPSRGRFRAYLLTSARNFLLNARARALSLRRSGRTEHESIDAIDAERYLALNARDLESSPEAVFERQWALRVIERALERLGCEYVERGQGDVFQQLRPFLTSDPSAGQESRPNPATDTFRAALYRARRRFGDALRAEIRDTADDGEDVEDELRYLLRALTR